MCSLTRHTPPLSLVQFKMSGYKPQERKLDVMKRKETALRCSSLLSLPTVPVGALSLHLAVPCTDGAAALPVQPLHLHAGRLSLLCSWVTGLRQKWAFIESLLKIKLLLPFESQTLNLREKTRACAHCSLAGG